MTGDIVATVVATLVGGFFLWGFINACFLSVRDERDAASEIIARSAISMIDARARGYGPSSTVGSSDLVSDETPEQMSARFFDEDVADTNELIRKIVAELNPPQRTSLGAGLSEDDVVEVRVWGSVEPVAVYSGGPISAEQLRLLENLQTDISPWL